ncbi:MAG: DUF4350 domain-containing protein [Leptolyngbya sp. SIO1E4]|nr:DUF4350 domain-containing protein [Leptolyngbya sp. SIO1E4]
MTPSVSFSNRYLRIGIVALVILFLLLIILAPATGQKNSGSTFNRAPEGYLGWYRYMEEQGLPVQRWQRPIDDLVAQAAAEPATLLRVHSGLVGPYVAESQSWMQDWLAAGNTVVILGISENITAAPFTTQQESPQGEVVIKTRRRSPVENDRRLLGDDYGAVLWRNNSVEEGGAAYFAVTPHLAANAYLDEPGNYAFLADLMSQSGGTLWVDEYLHGHKAADVIVEEVVSSWGAYLSRTPLKIAVIQLMILLGLLLVSHNRRLGNLTPIKAPQVDNSQAYIEALAAVLYKAESTSFLVDMIAKAERLSLQKSLGLNHTSVNDAALQEAWMQQTGQSGQTLAPLLTPLERGTKQPDHTLKQWLTKLHRIRQTPLR